MSAIRPLCLGLAVMASTCGVAAAQEFDARKIRAGQSVLVRDLAGFDTKGEVQSIEPGKLVIKYGRGGLADPAEPGRLLHDTRSFTPAEVERVRRPGPIWDGAVKGALIGLVPALVLAGSDCYDCNFAAAGAVIMGIGAGIGVGIDAAFGPKTVYRNRGVQRRVALVPVIGRDRGGFAASIRF